jgi:hypothetical protein
LNISESNQPKNIYIVFPKLRPEVAVVEDFFEMGEDSDESDEVDEAFDEASGDDDEW